MTKGIVFMLSILCCNVAFGQLRGESDTSSNKKHFNPKLSLGVGVGFTNMFGDFARSGFEPAGRIGLGLKLTHNLMVDVEGYFGELSSKEPPVSWSTTGFSEKSNFVSADFNIKMTLGNYLQYPHKMLLKVLSGLYLGTGIGFVSSNITSFKGRYNSLDLNNKLDSGFITRNSVFTPYIPINIGLRVPMKKFLGTKNTQFMLNYQINYTFSDYLDGTKVVYSRNQFNDCYTVITAGLSFHLSNK